jgi:hypothetical protein
MDGAGASRKPTLVFLPSHAVAIISLVMLPVVIVARYGKQLAGR